MHTRTTPSRTHSLTQSLTHETTHSVMHSLKHTLTHARTNSHTHSHMLTHSRTYTHSRTHACTHSCTYSFTHSLSHAPSNSPLQADSHDDCGVIFADIVNFKRFYSEDFMAGKQCIRILHELISEFDKVILHEFGAGMDLSVRQLHSDLCFRN